MSVLFVGAVGGSGLAQDGSKPRASTIIEAGRLIDVRAGRPLTDRAIFIEGERIKAVGKKDEIRKLAPKSGLPLLTCQGPPSCPA